MMEIMTTSPKKQKGSRKESAKKVAETEFKCKNNHKDFASYKAESNKNWFSANKRFAGSTCFICKISFSDEKSKDSFVPSATTPGYICLNSTKNCRKCLCNNCCVKAMLGTNDGPSRRAKNRN